jgi:hypothetical protein
MKTLLLDENAYDLIMSRLVACEALLKQTIYDPYGKTWDRVTYAGDSLRLLHSYINDTAYQVKWLPVKEM